MHTYPNVLPLTERAMSHFARWRTADAGSKRFMVQAFKLSQPEWEALNRLQENLEASGVEKLAGGDKCSAKMADTIVAGLQISASLSDIVRACRPNLLGTDVLLRSKLEVATVVMKPDTMPEKPSNPHATHPNPEPDPMHTQLVTNLAPINYAAPAVVESTTISPGRINEMIDHAIQIQDAEVKARMAASVGDAPAAALDAEPPLGTLVPDEPPAEPPAEQMTKDEKVHEKADFYGPQIRQAFIDEKINPSARSLFLAEKKRVARRVGCSIRSVEVEASRQRSDAGITFLANQTPSQPILPNERKRSEKRAAIKKELENAGIDLVRGVSEAQKEHLAETFDVAPSTVEKAAREKRAEDGIVVKGGHAPPREIAPRNVTDRALDRVVSPPPLASPEERQMALDIAAGHMDLADLPHLGRRYAVCLRAAILMEVVLQ